ncbi:MAG: MMPL family transporter [Granulosicoccaceae bacterium]|jgi:hypothetical protein
MLRIIEWILDHKYVTLLASLVALALLASGARNLYFTTDYRIFFSEENPQLQAFDALQDTYTKNDNVLFVIAPKDGKVFTRETLAAIEDLTSRAWKIPYSIRVDSVTNFQYSYAEEDDLIVADLVSNAMQLDDTQLEKIRTVALAEPLLVNRIVSPDARTTGVNVTVQLPGKAQHLEVPEAAKYAKQLAAQMREDYPGIDVYLTGMVVMNSAFSEASQTDLQTLVPAMFLLVIILLAVLLRSVTATVASLAVIIASILAALGLTGWMHLALSPPTTSAPTIIMTIAVANSVHILITFLQKLNGTRDKKAAMLESMRINLQPVFLTSLTTALGFLSMNFSDAPPFRTLGNIVSMGVAASFIWSVTILPALMMILPVRHKPRQRGSELMGKFADFVISSRKRLIIIMAGAIVMLVSFVPRNELNDEFVKYFDETVEFRRHTDYSSENLTGIYMIEYSIPAQGAGGIAEPVYLRKLDEFAQWYRAQANVMHVNVLTDTMKRLNRNMHGDDAEWYKLPEERPLAAQYLLLYELSLPFGLDLNNQINVDKSSTRVTVTMNNVSSNDVLAMEAMSDDWIKQNLPDYMQAKGSSSTIMFAHIGARNIRSMLLGTTIALLLISLTLVVALRSVKIGLISMIPNLVPAAMAFGLWGLLVGKVGLALSVVSSMTLGIIVDDTVHFLSKYLRARREEGMSSPDAVRYAFTTVGMALVVTSVVLVAGFLVLSLSAFELNSGMGLLTAITISFALAADFLFLPPLLMKIEEKQNETRAMDTVPADDPA